MSKQSYHKSAFSAFEKEEERLQRQARIMQQQELQLLIRQGIQRTDQVLDLGCGNGSTTAMVSEYLTGGRITGVDVNPDFIANARKQHLNQNLSFTETSAYDLSPVPDFDFIYSRLLFQHLNEPERAVKQVWGHLRPGGRFCLIDVNDDWLFLHPRLHAFDVLVEAGIRQQEANGGNRKIAAELPSLLRSNGFQDLRIEIVPFSSLNVGMEAFLDITLSFRINMLPVMVKHYQQVQQVVLANPEKWVGVMGIFVITATKTPS